MSTTQSTEKANLSEVAHLARSLLLEHGLVQWRFEWDRAKQRFGQCRHRHKTISLSADLVVLNPLARSRQTILHEIAHALVGPGHGHDAVWKAQARRLGIKPVACFTAATTATPQAPYKYVCGNCGASYPRHRRSRKPVACTPCCRNHNGGRWTDRFLLRLERNR